MGSSRAARSTGIRQAANTVAATTEATTAKVQGSEAVTLGISFESLAENKLALGDDLVGAAAVQYFVDPQANAAVMVRGVVPGEEDLAEGAGVLDRAEAVGELRPVLERRFAPL
jgi:hypothetical protein